MGSHYLPTDWYRTTASERAEQYPLNKNFIICLKKKFLPYTKNSKEGFILKYCECESWT